MEFYFTGEIMEDVEEAYSEVENIVLKKLNTSLNSQDYGPGLKILGIIFMIASDELVGEGLFNEKITYMKKDKDSDIRLRIDHATFREVDLDSQIRLLVDNLIRAVREIKKKIKEDFDSERLAKDIDRLFN